MDRPALIRPPLPAGAFPLVRPAGAGPPEAGLALRLDGAAQGPLPGPAVRTLEARRGIAPLGDGAASRVAEAVSKAIRGAPAAAVQRWQEATGGVLEVSVTSEGGALGWADPSGPAPTLHLRHALFTALPGLLDTVVWHGVQQLIFAGEEETVRGLLGLRIAARSSVREELRRAIEDGAAAAEPYLRRLVGLDVPPGRLSIAFAGMEFAPLVKVGGAGDVMFELPKALRAHHDVFAVIPCFACASHELAKHPVEEVEGLRFVVPFATRPPVSVTVKVALVKGVLVYLLVADDPGLCVEPYRDRVSELAESLILSRGVLELCRRLQRRPEVIHANDHHAALVPLYMRTSYAADFSRTASVFTIHNIGYQGEYPVARWDDLGLQGDERVLRKLLIKNGRINFMAAVPGTIKLVQASGHYLNTVSQTYAEDIRKAVFEIDELLRDIGDRFGGILNGIDFESWDPATDPAIPFRYDLATDTVAEVLAARRKNKHALQTALGPEKTPALVDIRDPAKVFGGLQPGSGRMLVGVVSRLVGQKQLDIVADLIEQMYAGQTWVDAVDFVVLGSGDAELEQRFARLATDPRRASTGIGLAYVAAYARRLSNWIYAAADLLLVPSDYEPSGLTQMIALRYGAVPLVRLTGGLADTVAERGVQTGFVFEGLGRTFATPEEDERRRAENGRQLHQALGRACGVFFDQPQRWKGIVLQGMLQDNDWSRSLRHYLEVYRWLDGEVKQAGQ